MLHIVFVISKRPVTAMAMKEAITKKLQQATCDKISLNRRILCWCRAFREVDKVLNGSCKKKK